MIKHACVFKANLNLLIVYVIKFYLSWKNRLFYFVAAYLKISFDNIKGVSGRKCRTSVELPFRYIIIDITKYLYPKLDSYEDNGEINFKE